jgi:tetratricopeptide (TPR) repeat protein
MPLRPSLLFRYGQVLMVLKRRARALEVFHSVVRADPRHRRAWSCVGFLHAARTELPPAVEAFEHALALDPGDAAAQFNLAFLLQRSGRHAEAIPHFQRALEADPQLERAQRALAASLAQLESQ